MQRVRLISPLFLAIGLGALTLAIYAWTNTRNLLGHCQHAQGTVVALSREGSVYYPVVTFTTPEGTGIEFIGKVGSSSPRFVKGEHLDVIYRPEKPANARINGFLDLWAPALFTTIFAVAFSAIGLIFIFIPWNTRRKAANLRIYGKPVLADYERTAVIPAVSVNGVSPFRIFAQWQDPLTSQVHVFQSDDIWYDPEKFIHRK